MLYQQREGATRTERDREPGKEPPSSVAGRQVGIYQPANANTEHDAKNQGLWVVARNASRFNVDFFHPRKIVASPSFGKVA